MDHIDDVEALFDTFVDDAAFEPTYSQALPTAAGRNVTTVGLLWYLGWLTLQAACDSDVNASNLQENYAVGETAEAD